MRNEATIHIAPNLVFHKKTKYIEIDCHVVGEKMLSGEVIIDFVNSSDQLPYMLTFL